MNISKFGSRAGTRRLLGRWSLERCVLSRAVKADTHLSLHSAACLREQTTQLLGSCCSLEIEILSAEKCTTTELDPSTLFSEECTWQGWDGAEVDGKISVFLVLGLV